MVKVENWNGYEIRFVWHKNEWWAVLADVTKAMDLSAKWVKRRLPGEVISNHLINDSVGRTQEMLIVNEFGIYETVFESRKKEAKDFKRWVFEMLKQLRQAAGLEGFQVFRMLDKEHQKQAMSTLRTSLKKPVRVDFIKANSITNKAVSSKFGYQKLVKKGDMTPDMLVARQEILSDTVDLMTTRDRFNLNISVSDAIYSKHSH